MSDTNLAVSKPSFFDTIYKTEVKMTPLEKELVATQVFERLKEIKQLGLAHLIYSNARHSRFEHCLGTMHLAGKVAGSLGLSQDDSEYFRAAALLHDIGHGPFSHAFEDYLRERKRIRGHEDLTKWVIFNSKIKDIIDDSSLNSKKIAELSVGKVIDEKIGLLSSLILGAIDVDKIDFLKRDAYFTGNRHKEIDTERLTSSLKKSKDDKIVWDYECLASLERFFGFKNDMYMLVYYSEEVRAIDIMIKAILKYSEEKFDWCGFREVEDFQLFTDSYVLNKMQELSNSLIVGTETDIAVKMYKNLITKNLLKCAFEKTFLVHNRTQRDFATNIEEAILNELEGNFKVNRRLAFVDILDFSPGSVMSFTKFNKGNLYILRNGKVKNAMEIEKSLRELLNLSYQIIRVYVAPECTKNLKGRDIIRRFTSLLGEHK